MVDSRDKGSRAEALIKEKLKELTNLNWQRTPGSGSLGAQHLLKGDLYVPGVANVYCVECKHYKDDHLTSEIFTHKNPTLLDWWSQAVRQAKQVSRKPLLIFKHDRSKIFVCFQDMPFSDIDKFAYFKIQEHEFYVCVLETWIQFEDPKFVS